MSINLKTVIENEAAVKHGGFSGAVFLTYSLNLGFYEQIIAPALERAKCSNVLIIADPDGYADALATGRKTVAYAGMRYVCTALPRKRNGLQHAKILLMAGKNRGRLLIGSGNLTLHGYSRNLEAFSHFEYDVNNPEAESHLAFHSVWHLIQELSNDSPFSLAAQQQLRMISADADWLTDPPIPSNSFCVWNSYKESIWSQFLDWREKAGLYGSTIKELQVFSPYYDQDIGMLRKFFENLLPDRVKVYISQDNTTLNAAYLLNRWASDLQGFNFFDIREVGKEQNQRLLHAKIVVGVEDSGSWCIAGSANMTRAAFDNTWRNGSNLELVTFRWSPNPAAFHYLDDDTLSILPITLDSISPSLTSDFSDEPRKITQDTVLITELTLTNKILSGKLNRWPITQNQEAELVFTRSGETFPLIIEQDLSFKIPYTNKIQVSESAFIRGNGCESLARWIDIPESLNEHGTHVNHNRIQDKLDTVNGAEDLFHELLDFLLERVAPNPSAPQYFHRSTHQSGNNSNRDDESVNTVDAPDAEQFVVPERDASGALQIGKYTRAPYDQNIYSLRNLLSIVLLKLTMPSALSTEKNEEEGNNEDESNQHDAEEPQANARQRLCSYLVDYCRKYSRRICQKEFIEKITPGILIDNQITLARLLLEFNSHVIEFTPEDFLHCYLHIWVPLLSPIMIGIEGISCRNLFRENGMGDEFKKAWQQSDVSSFLVVMTSAAFGQPPSWQSGLYNPILVSRFLALKKIIIKFDQELGIDLQALTEPKNIGMGRILWEESIRIFHKIVSYLPPAKERLLPILNWIENQNNQVRSQELMAQIHQSDLIGEFTEYQNHPLRIFGVITEPDDEGHVYCPHCGGALRRNTISEINKGKLVLCSINADAWLYKSEKIPNRIL